MIEFRTRVGAFAALMIVVAALTASTPASAQTSATAGRLGDATDPTDVSISLSQAFFGGPGDCPECAEKVVLGRNDSFPDNLAGAAATGAGSPLLLHPAAPSGIDNRVLNEIVRLLGPRDPFPCHAEDTDILILGGTAAISQSVEDSLRQLNYCTDRRGGATRIETAIEVADYLAFKDQDPSVSTITIPRVYIATSDNPADSASASARAARDSTPILVNGKFELSPAIADFFVNVVPQEIILLGGTAALSEQVAQDLQFTVQGATVRRLAGPTRSDTAARVAEDLWPGQNDIAVIVNGYSQNFWVWALPGAVNAAMENAPLLYVTTDSIPQATFEALYYRTTQYLWTIGPNSQVSSATETEADGLVQSNPFL